MSDDPTDTSHDDRDDGPTDASHDDPGDLPDGDPLADRTTENGAADDAAADGEFVDEWIDDVARETDRDDADPFERIEGGSGPRHGDPFDGFEEGEDGDGPERADPAREGLPSGDDGVAGSGVADGIDVGGGTTDDPFAGFDEQAGDPFDETAGAFTGGDVAGIDGDDVWERMESTDADADDVPGKRYVDVDKHSYCEGCEYFSTPPAISCSHDGTEILEFVDVDTVRVVDCPVVAERKALEDTE